MSLTPLEAARQAYERMGAVVPVPENTSPALAEYQRRARAIAAGKDAAPADLSTTDTDNAAVEQNLSPRLGPPPVGRRSQDLMSVVPQGEIPRNANAAIAEWQTKNVDLRPSPSFAAEVERWADMQTMKLALQEGLFRDGRFVSNMPDDLLEKLRGGFMYVGANMLAPVTPADAEQSLQQAFEGYLADVGTRAQARANEIIANHQQSGVGHAGATRATLTEEGQKLIAEQDRILNAVLQLRNRTQESAVLGSFKGLVLASQDRVRAEAADDAEVRAALRLERGALQQTGFEAQDFLRFKLGIQEDLETGGVGSRLGDLGIERPAGLTNPGRLLARTAQVFKDVEDPELPFRQIRGHFDRAVNSSRMLRLAGDPNANELGALYRQFPQLAVDLADVKVRNELIRELGAEQIADERTFERKLRLKRNSRLEPVVADLMRRTSNLERQLEEVEARETISFVTDLETATKAGIGELFEAVAGGGETLRRAFLRRQGENRKIRRDLAVAKTGEAAAEAMRVAEDIVAKWETDRRASRRVLAPVRGDPRGARLNFVHKPGDDSAELFDRPPVIPLEKDFSNLRAVLLSAERAGQMPWELRTALFSDDPNDMVANAAMLASDVMAPRTILKMINSGLSLEEVRQAFKVRRREVVEERVLKSTPGPDVLIGPRSLEELASQEKALTRELSQLNPLERVGAFSKLAGLATARWERGWKEMALGFLDDPRTVFDTVVGAAPVLAAGSAPLAEVASRARRRLMNAGLHSRMRKALGEAARFDPAAVHRARKMTGKVLRAAGEAADAPKPRRQRAILETYRAVQTHLDNIYEESQRGTLGRLVEGDAPDFQRMDASTRKLRRTLRQLDMGELTKLTDAMSIPLQALRDHQTRGSLISAFIQGVGRRFEEVFNVGGNSVQSWVARNSEKLANVIEGALARGAAPDWEAMPFSVDAAASPPDIFGRLADGIDRLRKGSKRVINATGEYSSAVLRFAANFMDDALAVRHLQAQQVGNQVNFLQHMERKFEADLMDLELAAPTEVLARKQALGGQLSPEEVQIVAAKRAVRSLQRRTRRIRGQIDKRRWDTPVNLAQDRELLDSASDADLIIWARENAEAGDAHAFWEHNRLVGESFEDFNGRVNRILAGIPRPTDSTAGLRNSIARRYLNAPGLSTKQRFDVRSGLALTPRGASQLKAERRSVRNARERYDELLERLNIATGRDEIRGLTRQLEAARRRARFGDEEFLNKYLGDNLGIREVDLKSEYAPIVNLARTEDAVSAAGILTRMSDMSDGRISTRMQQVRDAAQSLLFNQRALSMQTDMFAKRYKHLPREKQKLFDELVSKVADHGDIRALQRAADADPKVAKLLDEVRADPDQKVQRLFDETNHFRNNILRDAWQAGVLTKEQFDDLAGGYAPHLYSSLEHRTLLGSQFDQNIFGATTEGGLDLSELMRQRHHKKWKLAVYVRGGRHATHLFDTRSELDRFLRAEYGTRGKTKGVGRGAVEGMTGLGDPYAILEPFGEERALQQGFLGTGPSLFKRLDTLVRDMSQAHLMKTMDRPGWTLTEAQYRALTAEGAPDALRVRNQYEQMTDHRANGPLRGKWVHRRVAAMVDRMNNAHKRTTFIGDMLRQLAEESSVFGKAIFGSLLGVGQATVKMKQAIVTNKIARSLQTTFFNFLMDSEMFGVAAAGRDFSVLHPRARLAKRRASNDLFAVLRGQDPSPEFLEAVRRGVVDDTLVSHTIDSDLLKTLRETLFGDSSRWGHVSQEGRAALAGLRNGDMDYMTAIRAFAGEVDDPQINSLLQRYDEIVEIQRRNPPRDAADAAALDEERLALEAKFEDAAPTIGNSVRRAGRFMYHALIGDKKTGLFGDFDALSREVYGRVSNINRLGAYYHLLDKGISPDEAVRRINLFMQNYSAVPQALRFIGRGALGSPIIAFPYEMMRISYNVLKYNPEMYLGFMGGFSAANFMSMVAGGLDPYRVMTGVQSDSAGFPGWTAFASSLILPHKDGTWSSMQIPALNWFQILREPFGTQAKMFGLDDTPGLSFSEMAANVVSKFTLGQPTVHLAYAGLQGRDPETGQILQDRSSFFGRAARHVAELFVPPEIPFVGSVARDIAEGIEKPPYVRSGREISTAQRAIQRVLGLRLRGRIGSGALAGPLGEAMSKMLGVSAWSDLPVRSKPTQGFDDRDVLAQLYVASREIDPSNAQNERILDEPFNKLRRAARLLQDQDPAFQEHGRRLRDEALAEYEAGLKPYTDFHGSVVERARTEQERIQLLARALRTQDFDAQFDRLSVSRKVGILVGAALAGVNQKTFDALARRTLTQSTGELRTYTSVSSLTKALQMLDSHLESPSTDRGHQQFLRLRNNLRFIKQEADFEFEYQQSQDEILRAAADLFFGGAQ